jgi:hypothetical protein
MRFFSSGATMVRRTRSNRGLTATGLRIAIVLTALSLIAPMGVLAAGNAGSTSVFTEPIAFTFPAGTCPDLPEGLSIDFTGTVRGHFHLSTDGMGVLHVNGATTISGTATDSEGDTYRFNYHDAFHAQDAGLPVEILITDHFNLVGSGAANQLHTFFALLLVITEGGEEEIFLSVQGDPEHCDPL